MPMGEYLKMLDRIDELEKRWPYVIKEFIEAINDIGKHGHEKYGNDSFQERRLKGDNSRGTLPRNSKQLITDHIRSHTCEYQNGIKHDYFGTLKHQLAAIAFNAMMEFYYAKLSDEKGRK